MNKFLGLKLQHKRMLKRIFAITKWHKTTKIIVSLITLFSPIDIIPEAALGALGLADDAAAALYLLKTAAFSGIMQGAKGIFGRLLRFLLKCAFFLGVLAAIFFLYTQLKKSLH